MRTLDDVELKDRTVLMRVDLNVPIQEKLEKDGKSTTPSIANDKRIEDAIPTIEHILAAGATKLYLMSHLGRPKGKPVESLKLDLVAARLNKLCSCPAAKAVLRCMANSRADTLIGGGDTIAAAVKAGVLGQFTHESTGGSALLEFVAGSQLPGLTVLGY